MDQGLPLHSVPCITKLKSVAWRKCSFNVPLISQVFGLDPEYESPGRMHHHSPPAEFSLEKRCLFGVVETQSLVGI